MQIRELNLKELDIAYDVVKQLRVELSYMEFEDLIYDMRHIEYKMFGIVDRDILITYTGVAIQTNLYDKRHLYVFDLVTDEKYRGMGYTDMMIEYLNDYSKTSMCQKVVFNNTIEEDKR